MQTKFISAIIGLVLALGVGFLVHETKKPVSLGNEIQGQAETAATNETLSGSTDDKSALDDELEMEDEHEGGVPSNNTSQSSSGTPTTNQTSGITLSEVAKHNSRTSCWSAINGSVYDLTSWIPNHPGGEQNILKICGLDGSTTYNAQHGGQAKPAKILVGFKIGSLAQ